MKPAGLRMDLIGNNLSMSIVHPSRVEDKVWEAVEEAILAGWSPKQFIFEVEAAWGDELDRAKKDAMQEFNK